MRKAAAIIAFCFACIPAAILPAAADWPVSSRHFVLERVTELDSPETVLHGAIFEEGLAIGLILDQLYERYMRLGFLPAALDRDDDQRMVVRLVYRSEAKYSGVFVRGEEGFLSYKKPFARIALNMKGYRRDRVDFVHTLAHEMLHSIQFAYPSTKLIMMEGGKHEGSIGQYQYDWLIEGTADAAAFMAANGIGNFSNDPQRYKGLADRIIGARKYSGPLHMHPIATFPRYPDTGLGPERSYTFQNYRTSSFWRFIAGETEGLRTFALLFARPYAGRVTPVGVVDWVHESIKTLAAPTGGRRFPGGLPQAYAEFIAEFADLPFTTKYGKFSSSDILLDDGTWQAVVFGPPGKDECETIDLSPSQPTAKKTIPVLDFASACFRVSLTGPGTTPPPAFDINYIARDAVDEVYACEAVVVGSNGVTVRSHQEQPLASGTGQCKRKAQISYAPRVGMSHQNVVLSNIHAQGGSGSIRTTRAVTLSVEFVLATASASGHISPSGASSSASSAPTGSSLTINSVHAIGTGVQARHAPARKRKECKTWTPACPVIDISLLKADERFRTIRGTGTHLGSAALLALDGSPRQVDIAGIYGNPDAMGAMAMQLMGSEFAEVSIRLRAPEERVTSGMQWDDALITARVGTMGSPDAPIMSSNGPIPVRGRCQTSPPEPTGSVTIDEVGEGWVRGTFSTALYEKYRHKAGQDPCAARASAGQVSGRFTAPYQDLTQPPIDPAIAAYQVWAGLPAITWSITDYDALVQQAIATQRDLLRDWQAERQSPASSTGAGGGVGGPAVPACMKECFPGVQGCPHLTREQVEHLTPKYLESLPAEMRDMMRQQLAKAPPQGVSHILAVGMDVKGCMDGQAPP